MSVSAHHAQCIVWPLAGQWVESHEWRYLRYSVYHYVWFLCLSLTCWPGNITEKIRMSKLSCRGETVVDLFAGIGYFTLPLLKHADAACVHTCDWNEHAVEALKAGAKRNSVEDRCHVHFGDNREVSPLQCTVHCIGFHIYLSTVLQWHVKSSTLPLSVDCSDQHVWRARLQSLPFSCSVACVCCVLHPAWISFFGCVWKHYSWLNISWCGLLEVYFSCGVILLQG